jgi:GTP cyclohydrolase II
MRNGWGTVTPTQFGAPQHIEVERALGEFRGGRPVLLVHEMGSVLALPVDGLDDDRLAVFVSLTAPQRPQLAISARRARAMGIDASGPVTIPLSDPHSAKSVYALAADAPAHYTGSVRPADAATVAAIELAKLAQRLPALLVAPSEKVVLLAPDTTVMKVCAKAVGGFRHDVVDTLTIAGEARVPLRSGIAARFVVFRDAIGGGSVAVVVGDPDLAKPVPVRLHSACLTGDVFGSRRCDCGDQLRLALDRLEAAGGGIILYLDQEGRGLGLANKIRAYKLQDAGLDTVDANTTLGFNDDERDYAVAVRMLNMLGCTSVVLLTNNPAKLDGLSGAGIDVASRMPLQAPINADNLRYLTAKATRAGHWLDHTIAALREAADAEVEPDNAEVASQG